MKRPVHLPLYNEFLELFDNYKIQNWQAKQFWEKLKIITTTEIKKPSDLCILV
jgi:hypothetical protein